MGPNTWSFEPAMFHELPDRSVMPDESVMTTGYCAPALLPAELMVGLPVIVMLRSPFDMDTPLTVPFFEVQVAFVPQTMSATVLVWPPEQVAGPLCVAGPQSLSVTRIVAVGETDMPHVVPHEPSPVLVSVKSISTWSPWSSVLANPPVTVSVAVCDVGRTLSAAAPAVMVCVV